VLWGPSRHLGSLTAANWVSFEFDVSYSSGWGCSLINTLKLKKTIWTKIASLWKVALRGSSSKSLCLQAIATLSISPRQRSVRRGVSFSRLCDEEGWTNSKVNFSCDIQTIIPEKEDDNLLREFLPCSSWWQVVLGGGRCTDARGVCVLAFSCSCVSCRAEPVNWRHQSCGTWRATTPCMGRCSISPAIRKTSPQSTCRPRGGTKQRWRKGRESLLVGETEKKNVYIFTSKNLQKRLMRMCWYPW